MFLPLHQPSSISTPDDYICQTPCTVKDLEALVCSWKVLFANGVHGEELVCSHQVVVLCMDLYWPH